MGNSFFNAFFISENGSLFQLISQQINWYAHQKNYFQSVKSLNLSAGYIEYCMRQIQSDW